MSEITVNGARESEAPGTIAEMLNARGLRLDARGLAVALNGRVVPRGKWAETPLADGDAVEIVKPFSGG